MRAGSFRAYALQHRAAFSLLAEKITRLPDGPAHAHRAVDALDALLRVRWPERQSTVWSRLADSWTDVARLIAP